MHTDKAMVKSSIGRGKHIMLFSLYEVRVNMKNKGDKITPQKHNYNNDKKNIKKYKIPMIAWILVMSLVVSFLRMVLAVFLLVKNVWSPMYSDRNMQKFQHMHINRTIMAVSFSTMTFLILNTIYYLYTDIT